MARLEECCYLCAHCQRPVCGDDLPTCSHDEPACDGCCERFCVPTRAEDDAAMVAWLAPWGVVAC